MMKPSRLARIVGGVWLLAAGTGWVGAEEDAKPAKEKTAAAVVVVEPERFRVEVKLEASFEPGEAIPVQIESSEWTEFTVVDAAPHGARVGEGDVLIRFDSENLGLAIADQEQAHEAGALALKQAEEELKNLEKTTPLSLAAVVKAQDEAREALEYFTSVDREQQEEAAREAVRSAQFSLENAQEELDQLEKMYKADDLTEETEEIILKRARNGVESAERSLRRTTLTSERRLKTLIPREHDELKTAAETAALALELQSETLPGALASKRLEVAKARVAQRKAAAKLEDLRSARAMMELRSPAAGLVYYGAYQDGKWPTAAAVAKQLIPGGKVAPKQVLITVVKATPSRLYAEVPEDQRGLLETGLQGSARPVAAAQQEFPVEIDEIGVVPLPTGGFVCRMKAPRLPGEIAITAGMKASVSFVRFDREDVITLPVDAVLDKSSERGKGYVNVVDAEGKTARRQVETGFSDGKVTVIENGLRPNEKVLAAEPAEGR